MKNILLYTKCHIPTEEVLDLDIPKMSTEEQEEFANQFLDHLKERLLEQLNKMVKKPVNMNAVKFEWSSQLDYYLSCFTVLCVLRYKERMK